MLLGCIGDGFIGSSDQANTLSTQGMRVTQFSGAPATEARPSVAAGGAAPKPLLFKDRSTFDSTPEGNVGPIAEALARADAEGERLIAVDALPDGRPDGNRRKAEAAAAGRLAPQALTPVALALNIGNFTGPDFFVEADAIRRGT